MWVRVRGVLGLCLGVVFVTIAHWSINGLNILRNQAVVLVPTPDRLPKDNPNPLLTEHVLFFNRVPKTGSEMFVLLLQWLQGQNGFRHVRLRNTVRRYLTDKEQMSLAEEIGEHLYENTVPIISFDRHVHFTNFSRLGLKMPLYFSGVRDPVEKLASRFYYARATPRPDLVFPKGVSPPPAAWSPPQYSTLEECVRNQDSECIFLAGHEYDLSIPYFCGHQQFCRELNNPEALATAQRHVEAWYPVVAVLEEVNATLRVLEDRIPIFFKGITELYHDELEAPHLNRNRQRPPSTDPEVEQKLRQNLTLEYDFYHFLRQRLLRQFDAFNSQGL
ncbi:uronyl 2-sulfotransferase homolog pip-like [Oratosquilla oratoria]|uniref:uronyl 2-sulfotransferase homolog pip-like n=1 Tax=Oratosquilla oratoria TaxID=337810 RepID=UPI003F76703D